MVLRFFDRERGGIDYLRDNPTAVVLDGSLALTQRLIDAMPMNHGQRFLSGVLNETADLSDAIAALSRKEFEEQLCGGLPPHSLHTLWIGHKDKIGREQHFNCVHLEQITGKIISPYIDRIDRRRFAAWMESFNLRHGLPCAIDNLRERPDYSRSRAAMDDREFLMGAWEIVRAGVEAGTVTNRREVLAILRDRGLQVRGETRAGKPLQQPVIVSPGGKNLRLSGSIYYRDDFGEELTRKLETRRNQPREERLEQLQKIIDDGMEFRAHQLIRRLFGTRQQRDVERGKARKKLRSLMHEARKKLQAIRPRLSVFSVKNGLALLRLRRMVSTVRKHMPPGQTIQGNTPKERVGNLLQHTIQFLSAVHSQAIATMKERRITEPPPQVLQPVAKQDPPAKKSQANPPQQPQRTRRISLPAPSEPTMP